MDNNFILKFIIGRLWIIVYWLLMIKCFLLRSSVICASWKCLCENLDDDTCVQVVYISSRIVHLLITLLTLDYTCTLLPKSSLFNFLKEFRTLLLNLLFKFYPLSCTKSLTHKYGHAQKLIQE